MRWQAKARPREGALRWRTRFAWWPTRLTTDHWVWLARYEQLDWYMWAVNARTRWRRLVRIPLGWPVHKWTYTHRYEQWAAEVTGRASPCPPR